MNSEDSTRINKPLMIALLCGELALYALALAVANVAGLAARALPSRKKSFKIQPEPGTPPA